MALTHSPSVVLSGIEHYYDALNTKSYPGSGSSWTNLVAPGSLTITGSPTFGATGLTFSGSGQYLSSISVTNPSGAMTAQFWVSYNNTGAYHNLFDRASSSPMLWIRPAGTLELCINSYIGSVVYSGFHLITTVMQSSSPGTALYVDGIYVGGNANALGTWPDPSTFTLLNRAGTGAFSGTLGAFMFYNRALTAGEVAQNFYAMRGRFGL